MKNILSTCIFLICAVIFTIGLFRDNSLYIILGLLIGIFSIIIQKYECKNIKYRFDFYLIKTSIKFFFQRRFRGWDDSITWNLDYEIAKWLVPRLKRFKELHNGHPCDLSTKTWNEYLDKMIKTFEYFGSDKIWSGYPEPKYVQEGFDLFCEYFLALWW